MEGGLPRGIGTTALEGLRHFVGRQLAAMQG